MKTNYTLKLKRFVTTFIFMCIVALLNAQHLTNPNKTITIHVMDDASYEDIPFANLVVYNFKGEQIAVGTSNMEGEHTFVLPDYDDYVFKAVYVGYEVKQDTLSCKLPACIRHHSMAMKSGGIISCFEEITCFCSITIDDTDTATGQLAERMQERSSVAGDIQTKLDDFVCYPNPVQDVLFLKADSLAGKEILLLNTAGAIIKKLVPDSEQSVFMIDMHNVAKGAYFVVLRNEGLSSHTKMIIKQ